MDYQQDMKQFDPFLVIIATEMKRSFESPVIMLTLRDFAKSVFHSLKRMHSAVEHHAAPERIEEIVSTFHFNWLHAIQEVSAFKKRIRDTPKEHIINAIDFTVECVKKRLLLYHRYNEDVGSETDQIVYENYRVMKELHENLIAVLQEKQKGLNAISDPKELYHKILDESEELMYWLDLLYDDLAIQFANVVGCEFPKLSKDLTTTLREIVKVVAASTDPKAKQIAEELEEKTKRLSDLCRVNYDDMQIIKLVEKIKILEDQIDKLRNENSYAITALQHKTLYLEERILSLENLKISLNNLIDNNNNTQNKEHIFDHLLPPEGRYRLVEDLMKLWHDAIFKMKEMKADESQSIISILSVADLKEYFTDDIGTFTIDKYGRKIYKGSDGNLYQLNEVNELVLVNDDSSHVYLYDECGRYFVNDQQQRVYKAHNTASEYIIDGGMMLKIKEYRNGRDYWYDNLGCYMLDTTGKKIYVDDYCNYYENDGFGNLVSIRDYESMAQFTCPQEPVVTEESKYLQQTVGLALRKCLADVVLYQPSDPILYLAESLVSFRLNMEIRQNRLKFEEEMMAERELRRREAELYSVATAPGSPFDSAEGEVSSGADSNSITYQTINTE